MLNQVQLEIQLERKQQNRASESTPRPLHAQGLLSLGEELTTGSDGLKLCLQLYISSYSLRQTDKSPTQT